MKKFCTLFAALTVLSGAAWAQVTLHRVEGGAELRWRGGELLRSLDGAPSALHNSIVGRSPVRIAAWTESGAASGGDWFAISLDGQSVTALKPAAHELPLRVARFDPLRETPEFGAWRAKAGELWIVQYRTQPLLEYSSALAELGARVYDYIGGQAHLVRASAPVKAALAEAPFVRWVGRYEPALRVDPELLLEFEAGALRYKRYNVQVFERGLEQQERVAQRIVALGGEIHQLIPEGFRFEASFPPEALRALAELDEVRFIDEWSAPEEDMDLARELSGANHVESIGGFAGQGLSVEILDGGMDTTHPDLANHVVHGQNTAGSHGTCTSGIVAGSGAGDPLARGVLPQARIVAADYSFVSNRYAHTAELVNPALDFRCVLQSNSWGSSLTTSYNTISAEMDDIIAINDFLICQSQSNAGTTSSRPQAWSKNIVSVGGIRHYDTISTSDDVWNGASIGPAADGRLKPDLAHFYDNVHCTDRVGSAGYTNGNYYSSFGGTSAATPITAGYFGLFFEMWHVGVFGAAPGGASAFESRPHFTLAKAALINTATQWDFSGASHNLTRTRQGWGRADARTLYERRDSTFFVDQTDIVQNLSWVEYPLEVQSGEPAFKVTLVYRDAMGAVSSGQHRKNDLTLQVFAPDGTIYWGNHGLNANMWSPPGGAPNTVDTVENVFVQNPLAGTWIVRVRGDDINTDPVTNSPASTADFALWVTGAAAGPVCNAPSTYCTGKITSSMTLPAIGANGTPRVTSGAFEVTLSNALPLRNAVLFRGANTAAAPFKGGTLCVGAPQLRFPVTTTDAASQAAQTVVVTPVMVGLTEHFQWWFRDALDPFGTGLSNALSVTYCD